VATSILKGSIVSSKNGTFPLYGAIRQEFLKTGGLDGWLGAPKSKELGLGDGNIIQYFDKGYIYWNGGKATAYETSTVTPKITPPPSTPKPINGLPTSPQQAEPFFKIEYAGKYNSGPYKPSGWANCGPASLAMVLATLGLEPSGISTETSIDRARYLMLKDDPNFPKTQREGVTVVDADSKITTWPELQKGIFNSGATPEDVETWEGLDQKIAEGKPVITNGWYGPNWRKEFPSYSLTAGTKDPAGVWHINAILGKTSDGKYIVADPQYDGGPVAMTKQQLAVYFIKDGGNPVGLAFAKS